MNISHSVGIRGDNYPKDVKVIQVLINRNFSGGLIEDGVCGPKTVHSIIHIQKTFMRYPDGTVDVNGKTFNFIVGKKSTHKIHIPYEPVKYNNATGVLRVRYGQVTFNAEGNDIRSSLFFSRVIHWPPTALSGVTIGRGFDLGNRSEDESYRILVSAGVSVSQAKMIAAGSRLKGNHAKTFVEKNKSSIGEISHDMQKNLFELIYPSYVRRARDNYIRWVHSFKDFVAWADLNPLIRDVLVDFVYQGFTKGDMPMRAGMHNDINELITYIKNSPVMQSYEKGRQRVKYLSQKGS